MGVPEFERRVFQSGSSRLFTKLDEQVSGPLCCARKFHTDDLPRYILSELGSPGKSGSFFYFSRDYRFIIKTIREAEHKWLRAVLKDYYQHVRDNPHTLISR